MSAPVLKRRRRSATAGVVLLAVFGAPMLLPSRPSCAASADLTEAQKQFRSGVDLYSRGEFDAAYVAFRRAYTLAPSYKLLYNLGQVAFQVQDHAASLDYFERYLAAGKDDVPEARRAEVKRAMDDLWLHVAILEFVGVEDDAELFVDDVRVSIGPTAKPVRVKAGRLRIEMVPVRGARRSRSAEVAGGQRARVDLRASRSAPDAPASVPPLSAPGEPALTALAAPRSVEAPKTAVAPAAPEVPRLRDPAPAGAPSLAVARAPSGGVLEATSSPPPSSNRRRRPWASWIGTGVLAAGAAVTGTLAFRSSRDLDAALERYPADQDDLTSARHDVRTFSLITDGLLVGTAVLGAISLYLSLRPEGH